MEGRSPSTKSAITARVVDGLRPYQRTLVEQLARGSVPLPRRWITLEEHDLIALPDDAPLDGDQEEEFAVLLERLVLLCGVAVPALIERDLLRRCRGPSVRPPDRWERDMLRRGRGPAAVRNLLFRTLPTWPDTVPEGLGAQVAEVLDTALERRRCDLDPQDRSDEIAALIPACVEILRAYAQRCRLSRALTDELVSDVVDQLIRSARAGRVPWDLRGWTLSTAKHRLRDLRHPPATRPRLAHEHSEDPGELAARHLDLVRSMRAAADVLARRAAHLVATGSDPQHVNVVAHETAAEILRSGDVELALLVVQDADRRLPSVTPAGEYEHTRTDRRLGRIVRDALRAVLDEPQARESS